MKVRDLMTKEPVACLSSDSCSAALGIMERCDCGFVPVIRDRWTREVVGVVTDRDIALHLGRATRPALEVTVGACMTHGPKTVSPDTDLKEAVRLMEDAAVHRLPVAESNALVGVLSLKDIAVRADRESRLPGPHTIEHQVAEIVEAISTSS